MSKLSNSNYLNDHRKLVIDYINAQMQQDAREAKIEKSLDDMLDCSASVNLMDYSLYNFYQNVLEEILGAAAWDWINWYLYEATSFSSSSRTVVVNSVEYDIQSPEELYDICIKGINDE